MVVSAADVAVDDHICWFTLDCQVVDADELLYDLLEAGLVCSEDDERVWINADAPCAVVELDVSAAGVVQVLDDLPVARCDVLDEVLLVRVDLLGLLEVVRDDHLEVELRWSRNCLLCDCLFVLELLHELVVVDKWVVVDGELPCEVGVVNEGGLAVEHDALLGLAVADAVEGPHEIEVPRRPAEFAVCDAVEAELLLLVRQLRDELVFNFLKLLSVDFSLFKLLPRVLELCWSEEGADVVVAEWCVHYVVFGLKTKKVK